MKRSGFTLLELIIVIIIIGILATVGFVQYTQVIEKGRRAEAASILGTMRSMAVVWMQEGGHATSYPSTADIGNLLGTTAEPLATTGCNARYYFRYSMNSGTGQGTAARCTGGQGKSPTGASAYSLTLDINGTKGSTPAGLW